MQLITQIIFRRNYNWLILVPHFYKISFIYLIGYYRFKPTKWVEFMDFTLTISHSYSHLFFVASGRQQSVGSECLSALLWYLISRD